MKLIKINRVGLKQELIKKLEDMMGTERDDDNLAKLIKIEGQLSLEIDNDEAYWEQKARANWLQLEDKNTTFFHRYASARRRKNTIGRLEHEDGTEACNEEEIGEIVTGFFQKFFLFKWGRRLVAYFERNKC